MNNGTPSCVPKNQPLLTSLYIFQGFYGGLSIILYIFNILALQHYRTPLDRTFCRLYVVTAILCIIYWLDHFLIQRFMDLGYWCEDILEHLSKPTYVLNPYKTIASYCPIAILVLHFSISLNRLTVVLAPFQASKLWSEHLTPVIITALLIPLMFMWFMIPCKSYIVLESLGGLNIEYEKVFPFSASAHSSVAAMIFGGTTFICSLFIFLKLFYANAKRMEKAEKAMLIFETFIMVTTMMYATTQAMLYASKYIFRNSVMQSMVTMCRVYIIDIFILPSAWTLPFLSRSVRKYYLIMILGSTRRKHGAFTTTQPQRVMMRRLQCTHTAYVPSRGS